MVERGPFKSEVEGSIPSALTISQISVLDTDAPFFYFSIFICHAERSEASRPIELDPSLCSG